MEMDVAVNVITLPKKGFVQMLW